MKMPINKQIEGLPVSTNFFKNVINMLYDKHVLHSLHITGEIIGYTQGFCNRKQKKIKY